jgi:hypothetical protein
MKTYFIRTWCNIANVQHLPIVFSHTWLLVPASTFASLALLFIWNTTPLSTQQLLERPNHASHCPSKTAHDVTRKSTDRARFYDH